MFKAVAGVAAASGVELKASTYEEPTSKPALVVLEYPGTLSGDTCARISYGFTQALLGTPFEGVKALVLTDGMKLTLLDKDGHVLNRTLEEPKEPGPIGVTHLRSAE